MVTKIIRTSRRWKNSRNPGVPIAAWPPGICGEVEVFWLDTSGNRQTYGKLAAGANKNQHTFAGHAWDVVSSEGRTLGSYVAEEAGTRAVIDGTRRPASPAPRGRGNADRGESRGGRYRIG